MSDISRKEAIETLTEQLHKWRRLLKEGVCSKKDGEDAVKSLEIAIDSLKTDEAYQLEYEKRDFIEIPEGATNGDVYELVFKGKSIDNFEEWKGKKYDNGD